MMKFVAGAVLLTLGLSACSQGFRRSNDPVAADQEIVRDICWRYRDARFTEVTVACKAGLVTLRGTVSNSRDKDDAESIARGIYGVTDVKAELKVRSR